MPSIYGDTAASPTTSIDDLRKRIKYRLGWPSVKLEIGPDQIDEQIKYAIRWYHKHATGTGTKRQFLLFWLIPGQSYYTLPAEIQNVVDYDLETSLSGINTLFTVENFLWNYGFLNFFDLQRGQFTLLSYHLVLDYMEALRRYISPTFKFEYNEWDRRLYVQPTPDSTNLAMIEVITKVDSEYLYGALWIEDYSTARCQSIIGEIRSKFSGATLPGLNATLNGAEIKQEAIERMKELEERLQKEDAEGFPIIIA